MSVLVVGSVALDSVETPFGKADNVLGGSGNFFSASASHLAPVQLVGVIGNDYPIDELEARVRQSRPIDLAGLERAEGASFRWRGRYRHDLNMRRDARDAPRRVLELPAEDSASSSATRRSSSSATSIRGCSSTC